MEVASRLVKRGFDIEVIATDPTRKLEEEQMMDGLLVKRFVSWAPNDAYYFSSGLKRYLARNSDHYDLVHAHNYHAFPALYAASGKRRNKLVFNPHFHGSGHTFLRKLLHIPYRLVAKKIFDRSDHIICVSEFEMKLVTSSFKIPRCRVSVIPNGVNLSQYHSLGNETAKARSVLYVGRLEKYKRVDCLLRAMMYVDKDIYLEIIGRGSDKRRLQRLAGELNLGERVTFHESVPQKELLKKYATAGVFVTLSEYESYGLAVAEALAAETPCVVAESSALKEWVDRGICLGVSDPSNSTEIASQINSAMGTRLQKLKLADWDEVCDRVVGVYEALI
jgi:glycosyltransferase involved in cell wall biosynthesis